MSIRASYSEAGSITKIELEITNNESLSILAPVLETLQRVLETDSSNKHEALSQRLRETLAPWHKSRVIIAGKVHERAVAKAQLVVDSNV